jgi:dual specificity MAP kinase phosphatase
MTIVHSYHLWPPLQSEISLYMLEVFGASLELRSSYPAEKLRTQLWTNVVTRYNSEGDWHGIDLDWVAGSTDQRARFEGGMQTTSEGRFQYTFRVGLKESEDWQWLGGWQQNGQLEVLPPAPEMKWTQGPSLAEVMPNVWVGNFIAASQAAELGFGSVLNLAEELTLRFEPEKKGNYSTQ